MNQTQREKLKQSQGEHEQHAKERGWGIESALPSTPLPETEAERERRRKLGTSEEDVLDHIPTAVR